MRKFLLFLLFIVLAIAAIYKSPFSAMLNYQQAHNLYSQGQYEKSLPYFERSLFADPKGILARFYYVLALSKSAPTYKVQKKLFEMSESPINDEASRYAKSQVVYIKHNLMKGLENNYIYNAASGNDIIRWDISSFPLNVYIEQTNDVPAYYYTEIKAALNQWVSKTNFIKFNFTNNQSDAQILITFKDSNNDLCNSTGNCKYVVAYTEPDISKENLLRKMTLTFYKTNPLNQRFSEGEIYSTAQHEIGHTLGIMGHSDSPADIMYEISGVKNYDYEFSSRNTITSRDLKTLVLLYRIAPTITNRKDINTKNLYYAPLVIGKEDIILQKKLDEYSQYIKNYPNFASGYINIASVYVDMGDYDSALKNLNIARNITNTNDEKYLVEYDTAIIYFNKQEPQKAMAYALKAKEIKPSEKTDELISDIQNMMSK